MTTSTDDGDPPPSASEAGQTFRTVEQRLFEGQPVDAVARRGSFRILRRLGHGGMGVVYLAEDERLHRRAAIKCLRSYSAAGVARLVGEAQALAKLSHPNVVQVFEAGVHEDEVYIAVELVEGFTLRDWLQLGPREWRSVLAVYLQVGEGLIAVHDAGIVHRDLKPDNVMIDARGRAKVLDFGLARLQAGHTGPHASRPITSAGARLGTLPYMAAEQHLGHESTTLSDQFSFCVALYEGLYGTHPFGPHTDHVVLANAVCQGELRGLPRRPRLPRKLRAALLRGLQRDPARRWPSMAHLLAALRPQPLPRRIVLAIALFVGAALTIATVHYSERRTEESVADCKLAPPMPGALPRVGVLDRTRPPRWQARHDRLCEAAIAAPTPEVLSELLSLKQCQDAHRRGVEQQAALAGRGPQTPRSRGDLKFRRSTLAQVMLPASPTCVERPSHQGRSIWRDLVLGEQAQETYEASFDLVHLRALLDDNNYAAALALLRSSGLIPHLRKLAAWGALAAVLVDAGHVARRFQQRDITARIDGLLADELFNEAEAAAEREGHTWLLAIARLNRTNLALDHDGPRLAAMHFVRTRTAQAAEAHDTELRVRVLQAEARLRGALDDDAAAEALLHAAQQLTADDPGLREGVLPVELAARMANQAADLVTAHGHDRKAVALALARVGGHHELTAVITSNAAHRAFQLGLTALGREWAGLAIEAYAATMGPGSLPVEQLEYDLAYRLVELGEAAQARAHAELAEMYGRRLSLHSEVAFALALQASIAARLDDLDAARRLSRDALAAFKPTQPDHMRYRFLLVVGHLKYDAPHRRPEALDRALAGLAAEMRRSVVPPFAETEVELRLLRARASEARGRVAEAHALLAALDDAGMSELRDPIDRGDAYLLRSRLARRLGHRNAAARDADAARRIYIETGADGRTRLQRPDDISRTSPPPQGAP